MKESSVVVEEGEGESNYKEGVEIWKGAGARRVRLERDQSHTNLSKDTPCRL